MNSQLNTKVLVLNRSWVPIGFCSVREAFKYIAEDIADIMDSDLNTYDYKTWYELEVEEDEESVGTVNKRIKVPRIVRLKDFNKVPNTVLRFNRKNLYLRDRYVCQYCAKKFPAGTLSMDHVIPKSRGGQTSWTNIVTSCIICNTRKADRTPVEAKMKVIKAPYAPRHLDIDVLHIEGRRYKEWDMFLKPKEHIC